MEKDDIRKTLNMYGENFLFLDRVVMEEDKLHDGFIGFGSYTVPSPDQNPILKDHLIGMPLFGGHLQMEAAAQLGTFMALTLSRLRNWFPFLRAPSFGSQYHGPTRRELSIMGVLRLPEKEKTSPLKWSWKIALPVPRELSVGC